MGIQERLTALYQRFADRGVNESVCSSPENAATMAREIDGPFLIKSNADYEESKRRVVIVGQENNGWIGSYKEFLDGKTLSDAFQLYEEFDLERTYNSTFFQYFSKIRDSLLGSDASKRRAILWLNLFKFNQGMNPQMIYSTYKDAVLALQGDTFQQEIVELNPDVVLFLTGPYYDSVIRGFYPDVQFQPINSHPVNQLARVVHSDLPTLSFRTYHPGYQSRFREATAHCLPTILKEIAEGGGAKSGGVL